MFFEVLIFSVFLIKFGQNSVNYVEKITTPTAVRNVQDHPGQFYKSKCMNSVFG
jgi:hypothetical protein